MEGKGQIMKIEGSVALVTGSNRGLGKALVAALIDTDMVKALRMPKTSPADTARGVLAGIERGEEEIFPDPMAQQMGALWNRSHKEFERAFASF